nr:CFF_HP1_G0024740.mRNA.1.CDS.1 [Saccharomyces cerevisiae]
MMGPYVLQDPDSQFSTSSSSVPSVASIQILITNIKHPDETVNNHTKESVARENAKARHLLENINYTIGETKLINDASGYISSGLTA